MITISYSKTDHSYQFEANDSEQFSLSVITMLKSRNRVVRQFPSVGHKPLDFLRLYTSVQERSGYINVKRWVDVSLDMEYPSTVTNGAFITRQKYETYLLCLEDELQEKYKLIPITPLKDIQLEKLHHPYQFIIKEQQSIPIPEPFLKKTMSQYSNDLRVLKLKNLLIDDYLLKQIFYLHPNAREMQLCCLRQITRIPSNFPKHLLKISLAGVPLPLVSMFEEKISENLRNVEEVSVVNRPDQDDQDFENVDGSICLYHNFDEFDYFD